MVESQLSLIRMNKPCKLTILKGCNTDICIMTLDAPRAPLPKTGSLLVSVLYLMLYRSFLTKADWLPLGEIG